MQEDQANVLASLSLLCLAVLSILVELLRRRCTSPERLREGPGSTEPTRDPSHSDHKDMATPEEGFQVESNTASGSRTTTVCTLAMG